MSEKNSFESAMDFAGTVVCLIAIIECIIWLEMFVVWFFTKACPFLARVLSAVFCWTVEALCRCADWIWNVAALMLGRATVRLVRAAADGLVLAGRITVWAGWKTALGVRHVWIYYI